MKIMKMKKKKCFSKIKMFIDILYTPNRWFEDESKLLNRFLMIFIIFFISIGFAFRQYYDFPHFSISILVFCSIGLITWVSIYHYIKYMKKITVSLTTQKAARKANLFYYKYVYKNPIYMLSSFFIIVIFGGGGCYMSGAAVVNPLIIWVMILFSIVVYISIIGYLQYIFLAVYIYKIAIDKNLFTNLHHSLQECIPADVECVQNITKLSHIYRTAFFTLGSIYIFSFSAFCYIPDFEADCSLAIFYILWYIIFFAIVLTFPIVFVIEYICIKMIVKKIKNSYICDIQKEINQKIKNNRNKNLNNKNIIFLKNIYAFKIMESRDYPIISSWTVIYGICLSVFNFLATTLTLMEGIPKVLGDFLQTL